MLPEAARGCHGRATLASFSPALISMHRVNSRIHVSHRCEEIHRAAASERDKNKAVSFHTSSTSRIPKGWRLKFARGHAEVNAEHLRVWSARAANTASGSSLPNSSRKKKFPTRNWLLNLFHLVSYLNTPDRKLNYVNYGKETIRQN